MRWWMALPVGLMAMSAGPAIADGFGFQDGEDLLANCASGDAVARSTCRSYITGSVDTIQLTQRLTLACLFMPQDHLTEEQVVKIVVDYLGAHPDEASFSGARTVIAAMATAYPCPQ